ncbi:hypothetical protein ACWC9H_27210 [Streptomyces sp. NPDC001251]
MTDRTNDGATGPGPMLRRALTTPALLAVAAVASAGDARSAR